MDIAAVSILVTPDGKKYWVIPSEVAVEHFKAEIPPGDVGDALPKSGMITASEGSAATEEPAVRSQKVEDLPGEQVRKLRTKLGLSQRKLGIEAEVTQAEICRIERGYVKPHETTVAKLMRALNRLA